jgi:hypothetical protein
MKKSLMSYEDYYQELVKKYEQIKSETKSQYGQKIATVSDTMKQSVDQRAKLESQIAQLIAEGDAKLKQLDESFHESLFLDIDHLWY